VKRRKSSPHTITEKGALPVKEKGEPPIRGGRRPIENTTDSYEKRKLL